MKYARVRHYKRTIVTRLYPCARQSFYIFSYENSCSLLKLLTEREVIRGHSWIEKKSIMQARADRYVLCIIIRMDCRNTENHRKAITIREGVAILNIL